MTWTNVDAIPEPGVCYPFTFVKLPAIGEIEEAEEEQLAEPDRDQLHRSLTIKFGNPARVACLVRPSATSVGTNFYYSPNESDSDRNERAIAIATSFGLSDEECNALRGDVFIGRIILDPVRTVSFTLSHLEPESAWLKSAPEVAAQRQAEQVEREAALRGYRGAMPRSLPQLPSAAPVAAAPVSASPAAPTPATAPALAAAAVGKGSPSADGPLSLSALRDAVSAEVQHRAPGSYTWAQSREEISEVQVMIAVPAEVDRKSVKVDFKPRCLRVCIKSADAAQLVEIPLSAAVRPDECTWVLARDARGTYLHATLEKVKPEGWETLEPLAEAMIS